jgi:hypothetical protein
MQVRVTVMRACECKCAYACTLMKCVCKRRMRVVVARECGREKCVFCVRARKRLRVCACVFVVR